MTVDANELKKELRLLRDEPLSYGQETHGELHGDALAYIRHLERVRAQLNRDVRYWRSLTHVSLGGGYV